MTDKTANYKSKLQKAESNKKSQIKILKKTHESQLAMKAELIHNLEELIEEQESKIAELESHIKGSSPSQSLNVTNTKLSSIRKLVDSINDLHSEKSRIHETWLSTQSELETVKQEHKETVDNMSDNISELETKLRKSQAEIIKLQNSESGSVSILIYCLIILNVISYFYFVTVFASTHVHVSLHNFPCYYKTTVSMSSHKSQVKFLVNFKECYHHLKKNMFHFILILKLFP